MVDLDSGASLGAAGRAAQLTETWAGAGSAVMRASMDTIGVLADEQELEELVISGAQCIHLLRALPRQPGTRQVFLHVVLDRSRANLAMARLDLKAIAEWARDGDEGLSRLPRQRKPTLDSESMSATGAGPPRERRDTRVPDRALPPLPRRGLSRTPSHHPPPDPRELDRGALARIPGVDAGPPDAETMRRIVRALRELR
jgi:hypothetical protein